jgi:catechol 2,3-dioxygenase-like lactoylglutathione lyase family enzyme
MNWNHLPIGARIAELTALASGAGPAAPAARDRAVGELQAALAELRALVGDAIADSLVAELPPDVAAAIGDHLAAPGPEPLDARDSAALTRPVTSPGSSAQLRSLLDRFLGFHRAFAGALGSAAAAIQRGEPVPSASDDAAARRTLAEVNHALEAAWPQIPADLLLRGPGGAGRGRLTVSEFNHLVTPGGPGVLTLDKLARRARPATPPLPPSAPSAAAERSLRLNQVTIPVRDLARSIAFYRGLGLLLIVRDDSSGYARLVLPDGGSTFSLHVADPPIAPSQVVIYFECDDLDDRVRRLRAAGYAFSSLPVDQSWLWREATLEDPDGQTLCLYYAGVNRKDPPWRLVDAG